MWPNPSIPNNVDCKPNLVLNMQMGMDVRINTCSFHILSDRICPYCTFFFFIHVPWRNVLQIAPYSSRVDETIWKLSICRQSTTEFVSSERENICLVRPDCMGLISIDNDQPGQPPSKLGLTVDDHRAISRRFPCITRRRNIKSNHTPIDNNSFGGEVGAVVCGGVVGSGQVWSSGEVR